METHSTESTSHYNNLESLSIRELIEGIVSEDQKVAWCIKQELGAIEKLIKAIFRKMKNGGRLFYVGSGTSGRLGIVDASECPPTYGVSHGMVIGIIAGGDSAIRKAVEFAEDDKEQCWKDLLEHKITEKDIVVGITASGNTPYVLGGLESCKKNRIVTGSIVCNKNSLAGKIASYRVEVEVGPEFVTGSTRMKAGTAQKLILNMITTTVMIKLGKVMDNKMVDMQLNNSKLIDRGTKMLIEKTGLSYDEAKKVLLKTGSVRAALKKWETL